MYVLYEGKIERKGGEVANLDTVITGLTGFDKRSIKKHVTARTSFRAFFKVARLNPKAQLITGLICEVKIREIDDPLMKMVRYLDKLVDEVASRRPMSKILRESSAK